MSSQFNPLGPEEPDGTDALEHVLGGDPASAYLEMDETTREQYRQACRELAARSGHTPVAVAREAIRLCEEHAPDEPRGRHVGVVLIAEGRPRLEARLDCRTSWRQSLLRGLRRHAPTAYVGGLLTLTVVALLGIERWLAFWGLGVGHRVVLVAAFFIPVLDFIQGQVDAVLLRFITAPPVLPRLKSERVLGPDSRTLVVTPLLVTRAEDIEAQLRMMEINYLGNSEPGLSFALLTDFTDAPSQDMAPDRALLERLEQGIRELNERHGLGGQPRFFFFHRERRWNPVVGRWMGWERKRGKLEEFNRWVLGANDTSYQGFLPESVRAIRYIITLDADTHLLPGSAVRLVATLHHPLNQPCFDTTRQRVVAGYAMIQPGLDNEPTRAVWLSSGGWPLSITRQKRFLPRPPGWILDQSLFGTADFVGKGIYDVSAFTRSLQGRFPENAILSHDKLEGSFARVAYADDIILFESRPTQVTILARIMHRWTRGDWQLLPWLLPRVPSQRGRVPNPLSLLMRWKIFSDLRQSLSHLSTLLVLTCGWIWVPARYTGLWSLGWLLWICQHPLVDGTAMTLRDAWAAGSLSDGARRLAAGGVNILAGAFRALSLILPYSALMLDAIAHALYGMAFDPSRLLNWTTHAQASHRAQGAALLSYPEVRGSLGLALGIAGVLAVFNPWALPWASPLLLAWTHFVWRNYVRAPASEAASATAPHTEWLREVARKSWESYARSGPRPSQEPGEGALREAAEHSPTDLALGLVAPLSAYHLGYLELEALVSRLEQTLDALGRLPRHRGHFLDRSLGHERVSTAESGVVAAALVVVEDGLRSVHQSSAHHEALTARLRGAEARVRSLRGGMDFTFLYDASVDLFHTGYDVESRSLEGAHHGLLTSGALLAGFVAIAHKQIPLRHWPSLMESDRRLREVAPGASGREALAEHLLPSLFLWFPPATVLAKTALAALEANLGPREHLSLLALRFQPECSLREVQRALGEEPLDVPGGCSPPPLSAVRRQAMVLAAATNLMCDDVLIQHFHQHWQTAWVEGLVYETRDTP